MSRPQKLAIVFALTCLVIAFWRITSGSFRKGQPLFIRTGGAVLTDPALLSDGSIVFASDPKQVFAIDKDARLRWRFSLTRTLGNPASPAVSCVDNVYFGADDSNLYSLDANGLFRWSFRAGGPITSRPAIDHDAVYFSSEDGNFYSITTNGVLRWKYWIGTNSFCGPGISSDGNVIVGSFDGSVIALTPEGTVQWKFSALSWVTGLALSAPDTILVGCATNVLYALNTNGVPRWAFQAKAAFGGGLAIGYDGVIYAGTMDGVLYALSQDGTVLWEFNSQLPIESGLVFGSRSNVYFVAGNTLFKLGSDGLSKGDWELRKKDKVDTFNPSSPLIDNSNLWVGTWDGRIYRVKVDDTVANSPWPMAGQNSRRNGKFEAKGTPSISDLNQK
jgi:hypothetical protein